MELNYCSLNSVTSHAGINVRNYCSVGKVDQGKFAFNVTVKTLDMHTE